MKLYKVTTAIPLQLRSVRALAVMNFPTGTEGSAVSASEADTVYHLNVTACNEVWEGLVPAEHIELGELLATVNEGGAAK
ncbi:hypothetical protein QEH44_gp31 [Arthrobacter phage Shambre1]|uniref:Uncharacterized protein n=1 Tax=Arthrobacter phage Shambre1 TaxID=2927284 RepID=A0A977PR33_9CAUD|nr:hypothetical protein QEH44_gp31 [Arthrobacter phage Shambre1]UXE04767.1 hypothetical protein SEA_SHAMBRE1_31 [Arthrobacter phage Shambre1]